MLRTWLKKHWLPLLLLAAFLYLAIGATAPFSIIRPSLIKQKNNFPPKRSTRTAQAWTAP